MTFWCSFLAYTPCGKLVDNFLNSERIFFSAIALLLSTSPENFWGSEIQMGCMSDYMIMASFCQPGMSEWVIKYAYLACFLNIAQLWRLRRCRQPVRQGCRVFMSYEQVSRQQPLCILPWTRNKNKKLGSWINSRPIYCTRILCFGAGHITVLNPFPRMTGTVSTADERRFCRTKSGQDIVSMARRLPSSICNERPRQLCRNSYLSISQLPN